MNQTDAKKKPEIILQYNRWKGAVDTLDKLVGTYRSKRKFKRWPLVVFVNMLDVSAINAFIIFTELNPQWADAKKFARRRFFLKELGHGLVDPFITSRKYLPRGKNAAEVVKRVQKRTYDQMSNESEESTTSTGLTHTPITKVRARCHMCPSQSNVHSARCDKCKKPVCPAHKFLICESCEKTLKRK